MDQSVTQVEESLHIDNTTQLLAAIQRRFACGDFPSKQMIWLLGVHALEDVTLTHDVIPLFARALRENPNGEQRGLSARALGRLLKGEKRRTEQAVLIDALLRDADGTVRLEAACALSGLEWVTPEIESAMTMAAGDPCPKVRRCVAHSFGMKWAHGHLTSDPCSRQAVVSLLEDPCPEVRLEAGYPVWYATDDPVIRQQAIGTLLKVAQLTPEEFYHRGQAIFCLQLFGQEIGFANIDAMVDIGLRHQLMEDVRSLIVNWRLQAPRKTYRLLQQLETMSLSSRVRDWAAYTRSEIDQRKLFAQERAILLESKGLSTGQAWRVIRLCGPGQVAKATEWAQHALQKIGSADAIDCLLTGTRGSRGFGEILSSVVD